MARFASWLTRAPWRAGRLGLGSELLLHLGIVMALALLVLSAALVRHQELALREVLGRALLAEARSPARLVSQLDPDMNWWSLAPDGAGSAWGRNKGELDDDARELAERARRERAPLLRMGAPWEPIRFAAPRDGTPLVTVAVLSRDVSMRLRARPLAVIAGLAVANLLVFGAFAHAVLRVRVVRPIERVSEAARALADGGPGLAVPVEGPAEAAELAQSFNEMSEALARRSKALEEAIVELRGANESLRRTRAGLARAERLASVGRLAAGVAHEIGNPMGAILAMSEIAARDPGISSASRTQLERVQREGERVRSILRQLLDLARPVRANAQPMSLASALGEAKALISAQRGYARVEFVEEIASDLPEVVADPGMVVQILLNLLLNAAEALQAEPSPRILLRLRVAPAARRAGERGAGAAPAGGDTVECLVADNGCGIAEEDRERIFDPFFTTRPVGEGTGLGLPNALRMAEEADGSLELAPAPEGFRTAFALRLPCVSAPSARVREAD